MSSDCWNFSVTSVMPRLAFFCQGELDAAEALQ